VETVLPLAQTIIQERHLPDSQKSICPQSILFSFYHPRSAYVASLVADPLTGGDVGGIAGGTKFLASNFFLKFPKDTAGLYGDEEWSHLSVSSLCARVHMCMCLHAPLPVSDLYLSALSCQLGPKRPQV
jgi:hypothetical protein